MCVCERASECIDALVEYENTMKSFLSGFNQVTKLQSIPFTFHSKDATNYADVVEYSKKRFSVNSVLLMKWFKLITNTHTLHEKKIEIFHVLRLIQC